MQSRLNEDLNEDVNEFFLLSMEKITYERIKRKFDKKDTNEYGNLLHAVVQNKFDEEKVLKFIELLLENGYDVNYKSEITGYNFIQLALYGYTDEELEEDFSYSQEFIVKLIKIAKKYGLDVNTRDNDGDSIVHTAIASEVYGGEVLPILDALGEGFDISCKDNEGNSLKKAFDLYKKEAEKTNKEWFNRLKKEEQKLKSRLEIDNLPPLKDTVKPEEPKKKVSKSGVTRKRKEKTELERIIEQESAITKELEKIVNNINVEYLIQNKDNIFLLKNKLNVILTKKALLLNLENEFENVWKKFDELFKKSFSMEIDKLRQQNNIEQLTKLVSVLKEYNYAEELELINKIIREHTKKNDELNKLNNQSQKELNSTIKQNLVAELSKAYGIDKEVMFNLLNQVEVLKKMEVSVGKINDSKLTTMELTEQIKKELTLANKQDFVNKISELNEELFDLLRQQEDKLLSLITEINEQIELFKKMDVPNKLDDYSKLTIAELNAILKQNEKVILNKKKDILEEKRIKLEACINEILALETIDVFGSDELWNVIKEATVKKNKVKKK